MLVASDHRHLTAVKLEDGVEASNAWVIILRPGGSLRKGQATTDRLRINAQSRADFEDDAIAASFSENTAAIRNVFEKP